MVFADGIHRLLPYGSIGRHTLNRPPQLRPRSPRISPVCSSLQHVGRHTRPATPGLPHQSTPCSILNLIDSLAILNCAPNHVCGHYQYVLHDACTPSTYCPSYLLPGPQIHHKVTGVVSCVASENRRNLPQSMCKWFDRNHPLPVGLSRCLVDSTVHRHLGTSVTKNDAGLPDHLGQHRECIVRPH